ncbi:MAG: phosphoribosyl-ATP diphosphatase [Erythrobacter sp.]|jgi:phosphoribosyl-ATP pyrophosphohydrolase|nr:phosphoribosyl-ATP diphosphatase [Erythrobacter sp.]
MAEETLARLEETIAARRDASPQDSYVAQLHAQGVPIIAQKLGEEAVEAVIAAVAGSDAELVEESADMLFHLIVLLSSRGLALEQVLAELERREGLSGLTEKAMRNT